MRAIILLFLSIFWLCAVRAQSSQNAVWCFGDSVKLSFNNGQLSTSTSGVCSTRSNCSYYDSAGNLKYYANSGDYHLWVNGGIKLCSIRNSLDFVVSNGDSLTGGNFSQDLLSIPFPCHPENYFVFTAGTAGDYGLYSNLLDMNANGGLGTVLIRNFQHTDSALVNGINAIKHGNGRDWWIFYQVYHYTTVPYGNDIWVGLLDSNGIHPFSVQRLGPVHTTNAAHLTFSSTGDFFIITDITGMITRYDFDRCTGIISNPQVIESDRGSGNLPYYLGNAISPNDQYLYVSCYTEVLTDTNYLVQFDLNAPNVSASKVIIDTFPLPEGLNSLQMGPDNKIYVACQYEPNYFNFPYPDSVHNYITDNLSVINQPDSPGVACDLQKFSVYLGGRRTYSCLPNNPNYELGPLAGSGCDTLSTGIAPVQEPEAQLFVTYESNWKKIFVNAQRLKGRQCRLSVFDVNGKLIDGDVQESYQGYYTKSMEMGGREAGVYLLRLETEKEVLTTKFVIP